VGPGDVDDNGYFQPNGLFHFLADELGVTLYVSALHLEDRLGQESVPASGWKGFQE